VGVIPEDWEVRPLAALISSLEAGVSVNSVDKEKDVYAHDESILKTSCVISGKFIPKESKKIIPHDIRRAKLNPRRDSIVISRMNTPVLVGECGYIDKDYPNLFLPDRLWMTRHDNRTSASVRWLAYLLSTNPFKRAIKETATGTSGSMKNISKRSLLAVQIPLPAKPEQDAISEALSDVDAHIEALEQLVAKKRHLKQGAMQELLTGKKRLPGFEVKPGYKQTEVGLIPEDWEVKLLPEVCSFRGGKAHEQHISEYGRYVCVNSKFISTEGTDLKYTSVNFSPAKTDDILMVMSDLPNGRALAKTYLADQNDLYAVNQRVCALRPYRDSPRYLFYVLNRNTYFLKFDDGVNQTHLLNRVFQRCPLALPPTKAEEDAIATILSDVDSEIAALEAKLTKARQMKQGMMQELLTGRIRLV
jgi:type I restriction enzyme S subunit